MSTGHGEGNLWATIDPQERCREPPFLLTRWSSSGEVKVQEGSEGAERAPGMAPGPGAGPAGEEAWSLRRLAGRVVSRLSTRWGQPAPTTGPAPRHQGDSAAADAASTSTYRLPAHRHSRSVATASDHNTTDSSYSASTTDSVEDDEEEEEEEDEGGEAEAEAGVGPERGAQQTLGRGRRQGAVASRAAAAARALERAAGGDQGSGSSPSPSSSPPRGAAPRSPAAAAAATFYARAAAVAAAAAGGSSACADDKRPATAPLHVPPLAPPPPPQSASAHLPYVLHQRARPPPPPSALASVAGSAGRGRRWSSVPQPQPLHEEPSRALCAAYASHSALPHVLHRRVPPASVMASPWWRSMEENSPAFAAISQRFHVIAHAQARERLATSMARLAAMQEQERASRESEDAMRFALGMPALARWAETKATAPLFSFFLRTAHALLDLALELIRHSVLVGWVLLGVFNRLLMELMTAKRPVQTMAFFLGVVFASYVGIFGDLQDFEELFWE